CAIHFRDQRRTRLGHRGRFQDGSRRDRRLDICARCALARSELAPGRNVRRPAIGRGRGMRSRIPGILFLFILLSTGIAAWFLLPHKESKASRLELTPVSLSGLPGWASFDKRAALSAFRRSCGAILRAQATSELGGYAGRAEDWFSVCRAALAANENVARKFFEDHFSAFEVGGEALVTGYYEPLLQGSRTRHDAYQTPVYATPRDLIGADLGAFRPEWKGERIAGRISDQHLVPYATRAELDEFPPPASVLFYGNDPIAVFFLHIQGSGRVALDDGATVRVTYAAQNGRPYSAIGARLIRLGVLTRETVSMQSIRAWLKANPSAARQVMETNSPMSSSRKRRSAMR